MEAREAVKRSYMGLMLAMVCLSLVAVPPVAAQGTNANDGKSCLPRALSTEFLSIHFWVHI